MNSKRFTREQIEKILKEYASGISPKEIILREFGENIDSNKYSSSVESKWNDLLDSIKNKTVIPIIGKELLSFNRSEFSEDIPINKDRTYFNFYDLVANKAAEINSFREYLFEFEHEMNINNLSMRLQTIRKENISDKTIKDALTTIIKEITLPTPTLIYKLSLIHQFRLYITTTVDTFLLDCLKEIRSSPDQPVHFERYSISKSPKDIEEYEEIVQSKKTVIYHIFGQHSLYNDYVVTDEDMLEYIFRLNIENRLPNLFECLQRFKLLFIGCNFPGWLSKFFIRAITKTKYSETKENKYIADSITLTDPNQIFFMENYKGTVFRMTPNEFVNELYDRWSNDPDFEKTPFKRIVFISFHHKNRGIAKMIKEQVEQAIGGISVWYDEDTLEGGSYHESKIFATIKTCELFIALISKHTKEFINQTPYFLKEWNWAKGRLEFLESKDSETFIYPVIIDDTDKDEEFIKDNFSGLVVDRITEEDNVSKKIVEKLRDKFNLQ